MDKVDKVGKHGTPFIHEYLLPTFDDVNGVPRTLRGAQAVLILTELGVVPQCKSIE